MSAARYIGGVPIPRPGPAPDRGPLDDRFYDLVESRFVRQVTENPVLATYLGIHAWDDRLPDASRDHLVGETEAERRHLATIEALDPAGLSAAVRFERDLEIHNLRRVIFDADVVRRWERHSSGIDSVGDAIFPLFTRDFGTPAERYAAIAGRLEAVPGHLLDHRTRATRPQVRSWQELEIASANDLRAFLAEIEAAAREHGLAAGELRRLERAISTTRVAVAEHAQWVESTLEQGTDEWALGRERYDQLVALRAFDGQDADAILEIGHQQLAGYHEARAEAARQIDADAPELEVVERVKSDHPATFEEALLEYRESMARARRFLIERDLVTVPDDERVDVVATPSYLRRVFPFAAYFTPAPFDRDPVGTYVVTPSVDDDPDAMREHNRAAISNTSIHEAYPGHHLQLAIAVRHPSLTRLFADAAEFVEGWGMYSEQMMREEGYEDGPAFRLALATDAIWRACRIVLDIRMHRGELTVEEATEYLVEHTRFERPNALAEVRRYTSNPTNPLSYLLGKVLILGLREDERRRRAGGFSLRDFHDTLLRNGSLPISFHRRLLAGEGRPPALGANGRNRAAARP